MKHYSISYLVSESVKSLWRNGVMSFASIAVLMSLLVVIGGFVGIIVNINVNLEKLGLMNEIVVFVDYDLTDEEIEEVGKNIEALDNVGSMVHVTKDEALEDMKNSSGEYGEIYAELEGDENPLPDAFRVTYLDNSKASTLYYQIGQIDGVNKVNNRLNVAVTIEKLKNGISVIMTWFLVVLFVVSIFVIINTIKLAVFSRRSEIEIMRYIGATGWFITLPFIFEGIIIGLFAGGIAYFVEWFLYGYIEKSMSSGMQMITMVPYSDINIQMLVGFLVLGVITGIIGSSISLRKYLKA